MQTPDPYNKPAANPFASPNIPQPTQPPQYQAPAQQTGGVWRDGSILVMHKMATLPDACIKSNQKTNGYRLRRNLTWHHPAIIAAVLISPIIYIILAAVLSKRATIHVGLSDQWRRKRQTRIIIGWGSFFLGVAMFVGSFGLLDNRSTEGVGAMLLLGGLTVGLVGGFYGLLSARLITPKHIDDQYIRIKGAHPEFMAQFPHLNMPQQPVPQPAMPQQGGPSQS